MNTKQLLYKIIPLVLFGAAMMVFGTVYTDHVHSRLIIDIGRGFLLACFLTAGQDLYRRRNREVSERREREMQINLHDERRIMLREKSGRIGYIILFYTLLALALVLTFVGVPAWVLYMLWGLFLYQYIVGVVAFYCLAKRM